MEQTQPSTQNSLNSISCKIIHKETGLGLHGLVVVLLDIDKFPDPDNPKDISNTDSSSNDAAASLKLLFKTAQRLGSAVTDTNGESIFKITARDFNNGAEAERKPDLGLIVLKPEEPGLDLQSRLLYYSKEVRVNAGASEAYLIAFGSDFLTKNELPLPAGSQKPTNSLDRFAQEMQADKERITKKKTLLRDGIVSDQVAYKQSRHEEFSIPFRDMVSRVSDDFRKGSYFVANGQSVYQINLDHIKANVHDVFQGPETTESPSRTVIGYIYLTEEEKNRYSQADLHLHTGYYELPNDIITQEILPKLFKNTGNGSANDFFLNHPGAVKCRSMKANSQADTNPEALETQNEPSEQPVAAVTGDIPLYVARQMHTSTSPEEQLSVGLPLLSLEKRLDNDAIFKNVAGTVFQKGPADVPAYYEFHSLKMAFNDTWQEVIDQGLLDTAHRWYDHVKANGGEPTKAVRPGPTDPSTPDTPALMMFGLSGLTDGIGDALSDLASAGSDILLGTGSSGGRPTENDQRNDSREVYSNAVILEFPDAITIWQKLSVNERYVLNRIANLVAAPFGDYFVDDSFQLQPENLIGLLLGDQNRERDAILRSKGKNLINAATERIRYNGEVTDDYTSLQAAQQLTQELNAHLRTNYSFKSYAANSKERSVNFGLLLSYQQKWDPLDYQAGELVRTIPLAPKEVRKFSKKVVVKKNRTQKEQEENLKITKSDSQDTSRAESEIINKAMNKTAADRNTESKNGAAIGESGSSENSALNLHTEAQRDSQQTKKEFHESVLKASQEYKNERKIEITTEDTYESEITESGEITNPNDELTVTYLFYELQRQFRISEKLYRMRPVIMVAQEMPAPQDIDNEWILSNDWILKRVLLDDSFQYAIDCVYVINGDQLLLHELERTVTEQRLISKELRQNVKFYSDEVSRQNVLMMRAIDRQASIVGGADAWDGIPVLSQVGNLAESALDKVGSFFSGGDDPQEGARIRTEAATASYERADRERKELMARLESETNVLKSLTQQLASKRKEIIEKQTHISRFKVHVKDNILHYMQSIWDYESRDQRYFRLMDTKVPTFTGQYDIKIRVQPEPKNLNDYAVPGKTRHSYNLNVNMEVNENLTLKDVADLDTMLGYKGNYMLFPLNQSNILTDFMMAPYIDSEFELIDPDNIGNWNLEDYERFVQCLRKDPEIDFPAIEADLKRLYAQLLQDPLRNGDLITVPTGSLFIEALPGSHTILEYFKLAHRYIDVKDVQAQVRAKELENIRYAARLLNNEHDDPNIDKKILIEGNNTGIINPTD